MLDDSLSLEVCVRMRGVGIRHHFSTADAIAKKLALVSANHA